ncbi:MAG: Cro/CI family transcriptional regulator [Halomonas sp.]
MDPDTWSLILDHLGGPRRLQASVAAAFGVSEQSVSRWRRQGMTAQRALQVEQLTQGAVTRRDIRPDLFAPLQLVKTNSSTSLIKQRESFTPETEGSSA